MTATAQAQPHPIAGCAQAKIKCEINRLKGKLNCEGKAAKLGAAVDSLCSAKVDVKFNDTVTLKGCMNEAEIKFPAGPTPCNVYGDASGQAAKIDAFVAALESAVYTHPAPGPGNINACAAGTYKCVANLQKGLLGCDNKGCDQHPTGKILSQTNTPGVGNCGTTNGPINPNLVCTLIRPGGFIFRCVARVGTCRGGGSGTKRRFFLDSRRSGTS